MPVFHTDEHIHGFTVADNVFIRDVSLSCKAKGLLLMLLDKPEDWHYNIRGLLYNCSDGEKSLRSAVSELERAGYVRREHPKRDDGTFMPWVWSISDTPQFQNGIVGASRENGHICAAGSPQRRFADVENAHVDNGKLLNKKEPNKKKPKPKGLDNGEAFADYADLF